LAELREEMQKRAEAMDFERAAELRDLADSLSKTIKKNRRFTRTWPKDDSGDWGALERLGENLDLSRPPHTIECFDISHVSGTFVVASMVRFVGGKPDKRGYRRFKIKSFVGNDDFRAMEEVVGRRYSRLVEEGQSFPELVVIDGGLGQVMASLKAFEMMEADAPPLIGLAKREETIVFPDERGELKLKASDPALRLLQRVRDEAHRFANRFNADLRSKKIKESILDDFPGLGKVRRAALLEQFGSIEKMRKATVEELCVVEGFGKKMAERLFDFLKTGKTE
jgi:excinuclease ABC subunit C